jgi:putative intracellular protease/amidase
MKAFVVIDHLCEADEVVRVFSTREKAKAFIKAHKDDLYSPNTNAKRYDHLAIEEFEID